MLERYCRINQVTGIGIDIGSDGSLNISACSVLAKDKQLIIVKKLPEIAGIEDLKKHFPAKTIVALNLSGKGILHRQITKIEEINAGSFNQILPNANFNDFYIQHFISGDQSFVSVIRKTEADKWISLLRNIDIIPLSLSLGPFPVQHVLAQLNVYGNEVVFNGYRIQRNDTLQWERYSYDQEDSASFALKIESEGMHEKLIVPYAAAFQLVLAANLDVIQARVPVIDNDFHEKIADNKLKVQGFLFLAILFVLLLVNFLVFSWLYSSNAKLTERVSQSSQSTTDIQKVNEQVQKAEGLLKNIGWEENVSKSMLVDQLSSLLPQEITLKEIDIDPIDLSTSRVQKAIVFYNRRIRIVGTSEKIIPVNEWIARIKTRRWAKNIQLDNYTLNSELNTGQFTIIIDY